MCLEILYNNLDPFYFAGIWKYVYINKIKHKVFTIITKKSSKKIKLHNKKIKKPNINLKQNIAKKERKENKKDPNSPFAVLEKLL